MKEDGTIVALQLHDVSSLADHKDLTANGVILIADLTEQDCFERLIKVCAIYKTSFAMFDVVLFVQLREEVEMRLQKLPNGATVPILLLGG